MVSEETLTNSAEILNNVLIMIFRNHFMGARNINPRNEQLEPTSSIYYIDKLSKMLLARVLSILRKYRIDKARFLTNGTMILKLNQLLV